MAQPFFRGNYGSALGRVDTRPIIEAGRAQGQMFANLGGQIGNMIQQYGLNKQKREEAEAVFQADFGRVMQNPEQLASMQADPVIGPTLKRIQEGKGNMSDFDKYNAFRAADKQAELDTLRTEQIKLQGIAQTLLNENRRLDNEFNRVTMGDRKRTVKGQADIAQAAGEYAHEQQQADLAGQITRTAATKQTIQQGEEMFPLEMENIKSLIRSRDLNSFYTALGMSGKTMPDLEKRFSEISTLLDKNNSSLIKVKTKGALGGTFGGGEEVQITFEEYKKNQDEYAPLTSKRIQALQANEARLVKEQTEAILNTPLVAKDTETGEEIPITLADKLAFDKELADAEAARAEQIEEQREANVRKNTMFGRTDNRLMGQPKF
tara:strand:+ start:6928 stop:8061 length:1134 start_codon:yes stop_codon:yes gene_type:complete